MGKIKYQLNVFIKSSMDKNPGAGKYAAIMPMPLFDIEYVGGFTFTTNMRIEMLGCLAVLEQLLGSDPVTVYTSLQYLVDGMGKLGKQKANLDLWTRLKEQRRRRRIEFIWIDIADERFLPCSILLHGSPKRNIEYQTDDGFMGINKAA